MYDNENYNIGLLVLFHLLLVAILKLVMFYYVIKPAVKKHMKKISHDLPQLNEKTLDKYGIYHNQIIADNFSSVAQIIIQNNDTLASLINSLNELYDDQISPGLESYFKDKYIEDDIEKQQKIQGFNLKIFIVIIAILATIFIWYIIHMKSKNIEIDLMGLILGNIIPLSIIFMFEYYFIENIAVNYMVLGKSGFLYEILHKLYPTVN
jgi:hypothetical protein